MHCSFFIMRGIFNIMCGDLNNMRGSFLIMRSGFIIMLCRSCKGCSILIITCCAFVKCRDTFLFCKVCFTLLAVHNCILTLNIYKHTTSSSKGARWLSGRVSDSGARGRGFETYRRRVVSLSKTLYSPKVLVNYPGSGGSVPTWLKNCWLGR